MGCMHCFYRRGSEKPSQYEAMAREDLYGNNAQENIVSESCSLSPFKTNFKNTSRAPNLERWLQNKGNSFLKKTRSGSKLKHRDTELKVKESFYDFLSGEPNLDTNLRPSVSPDEPYTDSTFTRLLPIPEEDLSSVMWMRPGEFCSNPQLFTEGTTRFDIAQGAPGTCWFLAVVASLSEVPDLLQKVIPEDAYKAPRSTDYDGIFHCRFWQFGKWVDVYTDDYLPVLKRKVPWGARSASDRNEMWVSLLEKGFAKLHGSYSAVYGGQPGDSYLNLTGGFAENVNLKDYHDDKHRMFQRITTALRTGSLVTCAVPAKYDNVHGLVGGHIYTLNKTASVKTSSGQTVQLVRVLNPWANTEWTDDWSDKSDLWNTVPRGPYLKSHTDEGEFWISFSDFMTFFCLISIGSRLPDFDQDGTSDSFNFITCLFGEWKGKTAAGFQNRLSCPKFAFTIPDDWNTDEDFIPLVVQCIQKCDNRKEDKVLFRCDVFRVIQKEDSPKGQLVLELLGEDTNVYTEGLQVVYRHLVRPGKYVVIPSTAAKGTEKEFLIRIFSPVPVAEVMAVHEYATVRR